MYTDTLQHCRNCPQCAVVHGSSQRTKPPPYPPLTHTSGASIPKLGCGYNGPTKNWMWQPYSKIFSPSGPWYSLCQTKRQSELHTFSWMRWFPTLVCQKPFFLDRGTNLLSLDLCKLLGFLLYGLGCRSPTEAALHSPYLIKTHWHVRLPTRTYSIPRHCSQVGCWEHSEGPVPGQGTCSMIRRPELQPIMLVTE